jgi:hypothetical protein
MLRRFRAYLRNRFSLPKRVAGLQDHRPFAQIPTECIWWSTFGMFVLRLPSLNALAMDLQQRGSSWIRGRRASADTLGYALSRFDLVPLRQLSYDVIRQSWRRKAIHSRRGEPLRVLALDGHELWASHARTCPSCSTRRLTTKQGVVCEYYHRMVVAQFVGVTPPPIADLELTLPGEGETVTAARVLERVLDEIPNLVDVVTMDALYADGGFLRRIHDADKYFVVVLKQEDRDLYKDAAALRASTTPIEVRDGNHLSRIWDLPDLTSFPTFGHPVRVVWCEEETVVNKVVAGVKQEVTEVKTWIWITNAPSTISPTRIQQWGHDRWDLENRGFNELSQHWHMDHCFIHDMTASEALLRTLALAFFTTYLFYERNLKPAARRNLNRLGLARLFAAALCSRPEPALLPDTT